jgi:hypothetical protein
MYVQVDEPGHDPTARTVEDLGAGGIEMARELGYLAIRDEHVGSKPGAPVDDGATSQGN